MVQKTCPQCFEPSPIACKRCRTCDHEFRKRAESEPVAVVKKVPRKPLLSVSQQPSVCTPTLNPPEQQPTFRGVSIVNKKCTACSQPSPIACKRCRFCGEEFKKKADMYSYRTVRSPEPTAKRTRVTSQEHKEQKEVDKDESPELPVHRTKSRPWLYSAEEDDAEHEVKLEVLYTEKKEQLSYILQGINSKIAPSL
ncbi:uncharacterized protein [Dysidea avara]